MKRLIGLILLLLVLAGCSSSASTIKTSNLKVNDVFTETYKSKMSKEMDIKVRSLGLGDFNLKEQNGFLILTIDGVLVNLKMGLLKRCLTN